VSSLPCATRYAASRVPAPMNVRAYQVLHQHPCKEDVAKRESRVQKRTRGEGRLRFSDLYSQSASPYQHEECTAKEKEEEYFCHNSGLEDRIREGTGGNFLYYRVHSGRCLDR